MTTLPDRPNTALLVIDVQNGVVAGAHRRDEVVANINTLVGKARAHDVPVVWVQHSDDRLERDSESWQYVPELVRRDAEPVVHKNYGDSFEDTDLEALLAERGVGRLVVTGAQTDACIRATLHGGLVRGYDVTLVGDAHDGGSQRVRRAAAGAGDRAHQPLLEVVERTRAPRGHRRHGGRVLRGGRRGLSRPDRRPLAGHRGTGEQAFPLRQLWLDEAINSSIRVISTSRHEPRSRASQSSTGVRFGRARASRISSGVYGCCP